MSKLPNISQTPPVAAGEGFLTETEKKTNNREKGRGGVKKKGKQKRVREGGDDELSLLQGRPRHVPALS